MDIRSGQVREHSKGSPEPLGADDDSVNSLCQMHCRYAAAQTAWCAGLR